jgi:RimJ/RimL family protein N-acetyltransferase
MIKIEPLFATESTQVRALLRYQGEPVPYESFCAEDRYMITGLTFWQHWLPCHWHISPSVYVAKEDGLVIGMISLHPIGKSKNCWQVDHLVVHPNHRGRGIAQELLRFAFALFGSQGISHFVAEASDLNQGALAVLASCGFRRSARITHYQVPADLKLDLKAEASAEQNPEQNLDQKSAAKSESKAEDNFRLAIPEDQDSLYQLHQDVLPADIRLTFQYLPEDKINTPIPKSICTELSGNKTTEMINKLWPNILLTLIIGIFSYVIGSRFKLLVSLNKFILICFIIIVSSLFLPNLLPLCIGTNRNTDFKILFIYILLSSLFLLRIDLIVIGYVSYILITEMLLPSFIIKKTIINNGTL